MAYPPCHRRDVVDFHTGMTTEIRIRTSRPSTSKPSTRAPIPTAARGRSGATAAARAAARARGAAAAPKRGRKLREGDKCQAHFRGKSSAKLLACVEMIQPYARRAARLHFYTGTRARSLAFIRTARLMSSLGRRPEDNRDSRLETTCFAHRYEDGDRDTGLKAKYVKPVDSGSDRSRSRSRSRSPKDKLREGDKVEARFRRLEKYSRASSAQFGAPLDSEGGPTLSRLTVGAASDAFI